MKAKLIIVSNSNYQLPIVICEKNKLCRTVHSFCDQSSICNALIGFKFVKESKFDTNNFRIYINFDFPSLKN